MNQIENKRVALVRPAYSAVYGLFKTKVKQESVIPPMGLMYIAAVLEGNGYEVKIFDCEIDTLSNEELISALKTFDPLITGVTSATPNHWIACEIIKKIKQEVGCFIVSGGPHPTVQPEEVLQETAEIDFVIRYEGEFSMLELINKIRLNDTNFAEIDGLSFRSGNGIIEITHNKDRELIEDLNELPRQSYHLLPYEKYTHSVPRKGIKKMAAILTSRGCPNNCSFCFRMFGRTVRNRSIESVLDEIEYAIKELGVEWVTFYDDTFTVDKNRAIQVFRGMRDRGIKVDFQCFVRANTINDELMQEMIASGCKIVSLGIESGNDEILKGVKKGTNVEMIRGAMNLIAKYDIEIRGSFILGLPFETKKTLRDTFRLIEELPLHRINVNICTPNPGTELFRQAQRGEGIRLLSNNWQEFRRHGNCVIETDELTPKELINYQKEALRLFYTRKDVLEYHLDQFLKGEKDMFYFRPVIFALKQELDNREVEVKE